MPDKSLKKGILKQNGVHLQDHEYATVKLFLEQGYDIELIPQSQIKYYRAPDMMMEGVAWEIKAPEGASSKTIKHTIQNALQQSNNVIIDLCRCRLPQAQALKDIEREFRLSKRLRRLKVVLKDKKILDYSK